MVTRKTKVNYPFFKVVADGGVSSSGVGEGRFIPALIIDIGNNIEVSELIKLHQSTLPGDAELIWSSPVTLFSRPKSLILNLNFSRPMKTTFGIEFVLSNQFSLIDRIIQSRSLYLQVGKSGNKIYELMQERILIEVPNLDFDKKWNEMIHEILRNKYRKQGASRRDAKALAMEQIKKMRELWKLRLFDN